MPITPKEIKEMNLLKTKQYLKPLLYNLKEEELGASRKIQKMKDITDINFNKSFLIFSDIQIYRSVSVMGIIKHFDRSINYQVLSLSMLLDIWYSSYEGTKMYTKDSLRKCDILIIHGKNDTAYGEKKASVLVDLLEERKSFGKLTWMFVSGCNIHTYKHYQPGVIEEFKNKNVYSVNLNDVKLRDLKKEEELKNEQSSESECKTLETKQESGNTQKNNRGIDEII